jgi:hypothetical protein
MLGSQRTAGLGQVREAGRGAQERGRRQDHGLGLAAVAGKHARGRGESASRGKRRRGRERRVEDQIVFSKEVEGRLQNAMGGAGLVRVSTNVVAWAGKSAAGWAD